MMLHRLRLPSSPCSLLSFDWVLYVCQFTPYSLPLVLWVPCFSAPIPLP
jgi:hypothetical protein